MHVHVHVIGHAIAHVIIHEHMQAHANHMCYMHVHVANSTVLIVLYIQRCISPAQPSPKQYRVMYMYMYMYMVISIVHTLQWPEVS